MQSRLEGCILQRSSTQRFTKISTVSLSRKLVRVPVPMLWFGTSSQNIHKIIKGSNLSFETSDDEGHNLSRRFVDFRKQYERNVYGKGPCDLPFATSRLCNNSEEVRVRSCTRNRVLRVDCEFPNYDFVIAKEKSEDTRSIPEFIQSIRGITSRFDKTNRNTFFNHSSSAPSPSTVSLLATRANSISKTNTASPHFGKAKKTPMAKNELLWSVKNLELCNGRLIIQPQAQVLIQTDASKKGCGGCMSRDQNRGSFVQEGTGSTYKLAGTSIHKVCHLDICQNVENVSYTYPGKQHDSLELFAENERDKESSSNAGLKGNLEVSIWAGDRDYCRTFTR